MKQILLPLLVLIYSVGHSQEKVICLTIDDLPMVSYGINDPNFQANLIVKLLHTFDKYNIPAMGYVNEGKLYNNDRLDSARLQLLELWLKRGYELGNHTYSHMNYHKVAFDKYCEDILKGEAVTRPLTKKYNTKLTYFRHPYLRSGLSRTHADSLTAFLQQHDYTEAPVTLDFDDWLFAKAYHNAFMAEDSTTMARIGQAYISHAEKKLLYDEQITSDLFNRNIKHTLLIHSNWLNANYLDELIQMYRRHGYTFVSQATVLTDEVYNEEITRFGDWGISWIYRWAISQGKKGEYFKDMPAVPEYIEELSR